MELPAWLAANGLSKVDPTMLTEEFGVEEVSDLLHLEEPEIVQFANTLKPVQRSKFKKGLAQLGNNAAAGLMTPFPRPVAAPNSPAPPAAPPPQPAPALPAPPPAAPTPRARASRRAAPAPAPPVDAAQPAAAPAKKPIVDQDEDEEDCEVEEIIGARGSGIGHEYQVKWLGHPLSAATWEPAEHCGDCQAMVLLFEQQQREGKENAMQNAMQNVHEQHEKQHENQHENQQQQQQQQQHGAESTDANDEEEALGQEEKQEQEEEGQQQQQRRRAPREQQNLSIYRGLSWNKGISKWHVRICVDGVNNNVGCFEGEKEAARAYDDAARSSGRPDRLSLLNFPTAAEQTKLEQAAAVVRSKYRGVCLEKRVNKWKAQISEGARGTSQYLGHFDNQESAARAYDKAARTSGRPGWLSLLNFPTAAEQNDLAAGKQQLTKHTATCCCRATNGCPGGTATRHNDDCDGITGAGKEFECPHCGRAFKKEGKLQRHVRSHTGERPFVCNWAGCDKTYARQEHLKRHMVSHTGARPHRCDEPGCTMTFASMNHLKRHVTLHTNPKPFCCTAVLGCSASFAKHGALAAHEARHRGQKACPCPVADCGEHFDYPSQLAKHSRIHRPSVQSGGSFVCGWPGCLTEFDSAAALAGHKVADHGAKAFVGLTPKDKVEIGAQVVTSSGELGTVVSSASGYHKVQLTDDETFVHRRTQQLQLAEQSRPARKKRPLRPRTQPSRGYVTCAEPGCSKTFSKPANLRAHVKADHLKQHSFKCDAAGCGEAFAYKHLLSRHQKRYRGKLHRGQLDHSRSDESDAQPATAGHPWMPAEEDDDAEYDPRDDGADELFSMNAIEDAAAARLQTRSGSRGAGGGGGAGGRDGSSSVTVDSIEVVFSDPADTSDMAQQPLPAKRAAVTDPGDAGCKRVRPNGWVAPAGAAATETDNTDVDSLLRQLGRGPTAAELEQEQQGQQHHLQRVRSHGIDHRRPVPDVPAY